MVIRKEGLGGEIVRERKREREIEHMHVGERVPPLSV